MALKACCQQGWESWPSKAMPCRDPAYGPKKHLFSRPHESQEVKLCSLGSQPTKEIGLCGLGDITTNAPGQRDLGEEE